MTGAYPHGEIPKASHPRGKCTGVINDNQSLIKAAPKMCLLASTQGLPYVMTKGVLFWLWGKPTGRDVTLAAGDQRVSTDLLRPKGHGWVPEPITPVAPGLSISSAFSKSQCLVLSFLHHCFLFLWVLLLHIYFIHKGNPKRRRKEIKFTHT